MRIGGRPSAPDDGGPAPDDVATVVTAAAATLGMRPAIVQHTPEGRSEQGVASLANWAAKGAHLLVDEHGLGAGDRLGLDAPAGWAMASACLAAWWLGITLVGPDDAEVVVRHVARPASAASQELLVGDAFDGTAAGADPAAAWSWRAQAMPDRPPAPSADGGLIAVELAGVRLTQRELLATARASGDGVLGIATTHAAPRADDGALAWATLLAMTALRPLVTGSTTVIALATDPEDARGEGVVRWLDAADLGTVGPTTG